MLTTRLGFLKNFNPKKPFLYIGLLIIITLFGVYFRAFHFADTLLFEIDQARDYRLIHEVIQNGIGEFPLVGPKAGGTFFRLGPLYYIPPIILSLLFGISPVIMALPELIFSILTIPLLYFFTREFFSEKLSLFCTALFSASLFAVEYAHFSWNPNYIPFFILLSFYSALKYSTAETKKGFWLTIMTLSAAIAMQLHTLTLIGIPIILLCYFVLTKTKVSLKNFVLILIVATFSFSFLIGNEILTKGENTREFIKAVFLQGNDEERATFGKKIFLTSHGISQAYSVFTTSQNIIQEPSRVKSSKSIFDLLRRNKANTANWHNILLGGLISMIIFFGFSLSFYYLKPELNKQKRNPKKFNFLVMFVIWQFTYLALLFPLSLSIDTRFLLPLAVVPFLIICFYFKFIEEKLGNIGKYLILFIWILFLVSNLQGTTKWLHSIKNYGIDAKAAKNEFILESYFIVTMGQWNDILNKIIELGKPKENKNFYVSASPLHIRPIIAFLQYDQKIPADRLSDDSLDRNGVYFALRATNELKDALVVPGKLKAEFDLVSQHSFGTMTLLQLKLKNPERCPSKERLKLPIPDKSYPRCYEKDFPITEREKCMLRDLKQLF